MMYRRPEDELHVPKTNNSAKGWHKSAHGVEHKRI